MSAELIVNTEEKSTITLITPEVKEKVSTEPVDINKLLARVRKKKEKESRMNIVFTGITISLIGVVGIILSF